METRRKFLAHLPKSLESSQACVRVRGSVFDAPRMDRRGAYDGKRRDRAHPVLTVYSSPVYKPYGSSSSTAAAAAAGAAAGSGIVAAISAACLSINSTRCS